MTIQNEAILDYLNSNDVKKLAVKTQEIYKYSLTHCDHFLTKSLIPNFPDETKIDLFLTLRVHFDLFARYLENKKISGRSVQQYLQGVKIFMKWLGKPVDYVYKISNLERQMNKRKHLERWFNEDEIALCTFYDFPKMQRETALIYQSIVRLLIETGARVGEIASIKIGDIDLDNCWVTIQGKTEPRPVFFSKETKGLLADIINAIPLNEGNMELFPSVERIMGVIKEMLIDLGLKKPKDGRGPHTMRHWCATKLFYDDKGMRIEDIAYLMGDTVETIREHYLHPTPMMLRRRVAQAMGWDE